MARGQWVSLKFEAIDKRSPLIPSPWYDWREMGMRPMKSGIAIVALMVMASPAFASCSNGDTPPSHCQFVLRFRIDAAWLDAWIAKQPDPKPSREEAIRRMIIEGVRGAK
jgi:hypothetical protein